MWHCAHNFSLILKDWDILYGLILKYTVNFASKCSTWLGEPYDNGLDRVVVAKLGLIPISFFLRQHYPDGWWHGHQAAAKCNLRPCQFCFLRETRTRQKKTLFKTTLLWSSQVVFGLMRWRSLWQFKIDIWGEIIRPGMKWETWLPWLTTFWFDRDTLITVFYLKR